MAVVTVSHSIPDDLQAAVEAMGLSWSDFIRLAETDGPLVWKVLQDLYTLFQGGHLTKGVGVSGSFLTWFWTVAIPQYGPVAWKVIQLVLPLLGIVL